jgi:hypothetical protein
MPIVLIVVLALFSTICAGEAKSSADPIDGFWRGFVSFDNWSAEMRVRLTRQKPGYALQGLLWTRVPEPVALAVANGSKSSAGQYTNPQVNIISCTLAAQGDSWATGPITLKPLLGGKWPGGIASWKLVGDGSGILTGHDPAADKDMGMVWLMREERWQKPDALELPLGEVASVTIPGEPAFHYTIRLPAKYDHATPWPVFIYSCAAGNAKPYHYELGDELGWIMVGLTESRNGPWEPIVMNRTACLWDLRRRVNADWKRIYFTGGSGGARASSLAAITHPGITGGLLLIAGATCTMGTPHPAIPTFFITGKTDMCHDDVVGSHHASVSAGRPTQLVIHDGGHEDGPLPNIVRAMKWLKDQDVPTAAQTGVRERKR